MVWDQPNFGLTLDPNQNPWNPIGYSNRGEQKGCKVGCSTRELGLGIIEGIN